MARNLSYWAKCYVRQIVVMTPGRSLERKDAPPANTVAQATAFAEPGVGGPEQRRTKLLALYEKCAN